MDYTSIHIYGHLLSDDILHNIERDTNLLGNRQQDLVLTYPLPPLSTTCGAVCVMIGVSSTNVLESMTLTEHAVRETLLNDCFKI